MFNPLSSPTSPVRAAFSSDERTVESNQFLVEAGDTLVKMSEALSIASKELQDTHAAAERGARAVELVKLSRVALQKGYITGNQVPDWVLQRIDSPVDIKQYREELSVQ